MEKGSKLLPDSSNKKFPKINSKFTGLLRSILSNNEIEFF